jgi:DNA-binding HxlR family transcriptional regulator
MSKTTTTRKKVKVVGTEEYLNVRTGQLEEMNVINIEERDANFHKLWLGHVIQALDMIGNKKIKVVTYILENLNNENMFIMTQRKMADKIGVSYQTIAETMKALQDADFLKKKQFGVYQVNPNVIFKGQRGARMNVLLRYQETDPRQVKITDIVEMQDIDSQPKAV